MWMGVNNLNLEIMWKIIAMPENTPIVLFETNDKQIAENLVDKYLKEYEGQDVAFALYNNGTYYPCIL